MASSSLPGKVSFDEYLEREEVAEFRSEYRSGEIFAMSGGTVPHGLLKYRASRFLKSAFPSCGVIESDLKVYAPDVNEGMYPDVVVFCDPPSFRSGRKDVILNPQLIVEVLSPSTRHYDLSMKASFYRTIASLATLIFIDSERQWIQRQVRQNDEWVIKELSAPGETVVLIGDMQAITVADIYEGIQLL